MFGKTVKSPRFDLVAMLGDVLAWKLPCSITDTEALLKSASRALPSHRKCFAWQDLGHSAPNLSRT